MVRAESDRSVSLSMGMRSEIDLMMIEKALDKPTAVVDMDNSLLGVLDRFEAAVVDMTERLLGPPSR